MVDFSSSLSTDEISHRCFIDVELKDVIVIRKKDAIVTNGTTGLTCWRVSFTAFQI